MKRRTITSCQSAGRTCQLSGLGLAAARPSPASSMPWEASTQQVSCNSAFAEPCLGLRGQASAKQPSLALRFLSCVTTPLIPFSHPLLTLDEVRNPRLIPDNTALTVQGDDAQQGRGDAHLHGKGFRLRQVTPDALAGTDRASRVTPSSAWVAGPSPGTKGTAGGKCLGRRPFSLDHDQGRWRGAVPTPALAAVSGRLRAVLRALPEVLGAAGPAQRPPHGRAPCSPRERPRPDCCRFPALPREQVPCAQSLTLRSVSGGT